MSERDPRWATAIHEAGHAVAAWSLDIPLGQASIDPSDGARGHFMAGDGWYDRISQEDLIDAGYGCTRGRFIDPRVRSWMEREIMMTLAGGLTQMHVTGCLDTDTGSGLWTGDAAEAWLAAYGVEGEDRLVIGGDLSKGRELAWSMSGSDEEAAAYFGWLEARTRNMIADGLFVAAVEAVANGLLHQTTASDRHIRQWIHEGRQSWYDAHTRPPAGDRS
jgi:hypothetical protein